MFTHTCSIRHRNQSQICATVCIIYYSFLYCLREKLHIRLLLRIISRFTVTIAIKFPFLVSSLCEQQCPCHNFKEVTFYVFKKKENNSSKRNHILSSSDLCFASHLSYSVCKSICFSYHFPDKFPMLCSLR